ncbi:MAG: MarR family transcriptional regulator [Bacillota bacterium]|nr:MarR family transcriptional regulator [Bacillota bacterium]
MDEIGNRIRVLKVMRRVMDHIRLSMEEHFKELNITGPQGMVIGTIMHYGEMKISDISEKLSLSNSTVSGIIDRLEKQGLVERIRSKDDRRVVYVSVAPNFRKRAKAKHKVVEESFQAMMNKATPEEIDIIHKGLDTLEKVMDRQKINKE